MSLGVTRRRRPRSNGRPFKAKWRRYVRVHHAEFAAGELRNGVSLNALVDALGGDAFRTTQLNARANNGRNVNLRKAFMQQASVRLTDQAAGCLTSRLQEALAVHGRLPASDLDGLDRPRIREGPFTTRAHIRASKAGPL
jgi:hypothetical protein